MKNRFHLLATAVVSLLCVSCTETQVSQSGSEKAVNPPIMGWSSWNAFRVDISEDIIKNQADLMVKKGLKDALCAPGGGAEIRVRLHYRRAYRNN